MIQLANYSRYQDAMIAQAELARWAASAPAEAWALGQHTSETDDEKRTHIRISRSALVEAEPVYVSHEACEMVDYAKESFTPEAVLPGDPFTPCGFALLAKPIMLRNTPMRVINWLSIHTEDFSQGYFWVDFYWDRRDDAARFAGVPEWENSIRPGSLDLPWLLRVESLRWTWGLTPDDGFEEHAQLAQAFWRIASQFHPAKERAPRGVWRDANRRGVKGRDITLVRLRRSREYQEVEPAGRGLSVRFPVRGHWRNQWFPKLGDHRQIWIHPYVKGPDAAPFVMKPRVWEFTR